MPRTPWVGEIRAVLFDFDGVIADTETAHFVTFSKVLAQEGIALGPEETQGSYMGIQDRRAFEIAFENAGRPLPDELRDELTNRKSDLYDASVPDIGVFPGARELIESASLRGPTTIASGGRRRDISAVLSRNGLLDHFASFVSGDETGRSKPDPEAFLLGLELIRREAAPDLEAASCLVFEDSYHGVEAAKRAGMRCVAVTHSFPAEKLGKADLVIDSLLDWRW
jgi:HAD superfamily hydrolase (TIGR01509 family)